MRVLVTGAAGFIGSHLSERLVRSGAEVVGLDALTTFYDPFTKLGNLAWLMKQRSFSFFQGEIATVNLSYLLDGVTHVVHLAGQAGVRPSWGRDFQAYVHHNIEATQLLLEACIGRPLRSVVCASSSSVYGDRTLVSDSSLHPISPYGVTKLAAEQLCHAYRIAHGVRTVAMRYFTVYGPRQRPDMAFTKFMRAIAADKPVTVFGDGRQTRDFTYVSDAVAATQSAMERGLPGAVYNIGGGARVSVLEVLEQLAVVTGRTPRVEHVAGPRGDVRDTLADTDTANWDLDYSPEVSLHAGLALQWDWMHQAARQPEATR